MITFTSGTKAKASEVNANFLELLNLVNSLSTDYSDFIKKDGSVDFTKLQKYAPSTISAASNATPIVITSTNHGRSNGDTVYITGVVGNTAANGVWTVANKTTNTFELLDSAGNGIYTSGGICLIFPEANEDIPTKGYVDYQISMNDEIELLGTDGVIDENFTLIDNKFNKGQITAPCALTFPTITDANKLSVCSFEFTLDEIVKSVTGATNASPIVITSTAHGASTGDKVTISGVLGNTAANGTWKITKLTDNTFSLTGSTGNAAYTSGGSAKFIYPTMPACTWDYNAEPTFTTTTTNLITAYNSGDGWRTNYRQIGA